MTIPLMALAPALALFFTSGCLASTTQAELDQLLRAPPEEHRAAGPRVRIEPPAPPALDPTDEAALATEARFDRIFPIVLARNPDLRETEERYLAALARVPAAARLPDLELKYEQWGVPLARPYALHQANTLMIGLRQMLPAPGSLQARARAALEEARMGREAVRARSLDLGREVRRALAEYYRADREYRVHLEYIALAERIIELARANYRAGRGSQQDVLRTLVELSRLHTAVAGIEQAQRSSQAMLNTLMARVPDALLGSAPELPPPELPGEGNPLGELLRRLDAQRPELAAASQAVRRSEAVLDAARITARVPSIMVGADYWYQPTSQIPQARHAYAGMVAINLPWLNQRHREEVVEAQHRLGADRQALASARNVARYQLADALARAQAARSAFTIIDRDLLPQARHSYEAAEAAYRAGQEDALRLLDALRSYLDVRIERSRALAQLESSHADLERAVGGLEPQPRPEDRRQP